jgi:hypothetical protein
MVGRTASSMVDRLAKVPRLLMVGVAIVGGVTSGLSAAEVEEATLYKCHSSAQGCVNGGHVYCEGSCGPSGCKCTHYDAIT